MRSFTFTNDNGRSVEIIGGWGQCMLSAFDTGLLEGRAQTVVTPGKDGHVTGNLTRGARSVNLEGYLLAQSPREMDELKHHFYAAFDVRYFGELLFVNHAGRYRLRCRALALPSLVADGGGGLLYKFSVTLQSDSPYFAVDTPGMVAAGITYLNHRFPWFLPAEGAPFGLNYIDAIAHNPSDLALYPIIEIMCSGGATVRIVNDTTGAELHILRPVGENQKMVVDTDRCTAVLYQKNGDVWEEVENVLRWLSLESSIRDFTLVPGENIINVNEGLPTGQPITYVRYSIPAMGV